MATTKSWSILRRRTRTSILTFLICLFFLYSFPRSVTNQTPNSPAHPKTLQCPQSPIAEDILVVVRTGATEVLEKLPVHLDTTLRCISNHIIYSDYEEDIEGYHIHDVFDETSEDFKHSVPDFDLYYRLRSTGRDGLSRTGHSGSGPAGSLDNPGWKLDKFKFLPMVDKALRHSPHAKWFVFIELDTYLMWGNLLEYLSNFDAQTPHYIGRPMYIGDVVFGYGGSGFVLSAAAIKKVTEHWRIYRAEYDQYTIEQWAGDMVLGKALTDVNVTLLWALPHIQGDPVSALDHSSSKEGRRPWCYPTITYHHMPSDEIRSLWEFEQDWQRTTNASARHADVFKKYLLPKMPAERKEWDNYCTNPDYNTTDREAHDSFESCRSACESKADCLQFSYGARCLVSNEVRLGRKATSQCLDYSGSGSKCEKTAEMEQGSQDHGIVSGWMVERLAEYVTRLDESCDEASPRWVT